jgi:FeS assembly SUF system regulator
MLRISKLADYATIVMCFLAEQPNTQFSAACVAEKTSIAIPTVSKILKRLNEADLLHSTRGSNGGYRLARSPEQISIATVITVIDGTPMMTQCSQGADVCSHDQVCALRGNWQFINRVVFDVLNRLTLVDMHKNLDLSHLGALNER